MTPKYLDNSPFTLSGVLVFFPAALNFMADAYLLPTVLANVSSTLASTPTDRLALRVNRSTCR